VPCFSGESGGGGQVFMSYYTAASPPRATTVRYKEYGNNVKEKTRLHFLLAANNNEGEKKDHIVWLIKRETLVLCFI
jgi:hypothetical protein